MPKKFNVCVRFCFGGMFIVKRAIYDALARFQSLILKDLELAYLMMKQF